MKATDFLEQFPDSVNVCRVTDFASVRILGEGGGLLGAFSGIARYVCTALSLWQDNTELLLADPEYA